MQNPNLKALPARLTSERAATLVGSKGAVDETTVVGDA